MQADKLKGHLDLLLMEIVGARPAHGYAIIEALRDRSGGVFDLPEGTVYPALHRLEAAGVLQSEWSVVGGRRRRLYSLTAAGRAANANRAPPMADVHDRGWVGAGRRRDPYGGNLMTSPEWIGEDSPVEVYLDELLLVLPGTPRQIRHQLAETEAHLRDATAEGVARGLTEIQAEADAVARFGPCQLIAGAEAGAQR